MYKEACLSLLRSIGWMDLKPRITQSDSYIRKITLAALWKIDWRSSRLEVVGPVSRLL